ncbi:hypothetical protein [Bacillus sp. Marseille-Q3570]|uniref:hypothetical protein n=1 Tax=Bacillus sp. Marseille-Q3570 TaxID=2963522 RepID=UPI0021B7EC0D|nr:hypothetical protein [Bacillus sp. Marseille-Q3570]
MLQKTEMLFTCEIMERAFNFVGQCVTANFPDAFPNGDTQQVRKEDSRNQECCKS